MLLTANGQNIYPEEIESRLNNLPYIADSVVVLREYRLVALIYPDMDAVKADNVTTEELKSIMDNNKAKLNDSVAQYERISAIEIVETEFEKTPKKSIKRYLYS